MWLRLQIVLKYFPNDIVDLICDLEPALTVFFVSVHNYVGYCSVGRLLRAYNIEFNWYKLASWINITEQWPYRLSWIILEVEDNSDTEDTQPLKAVYERYCSSSRCALLLPAAD